MENQTSKDKVKGIGYLKIHLTNFVLMCKENGKVMKITAGFLLIIVTALVFIAVMETRAATSATVLSTEENGEGLIEEVSVPEEALEKDAYPEVLNLVKLYYQAQAEGDLDTIRRIKSSLGEEEAVIITEKSRYLEAYPTITVYTKKGPEEGSFVAYAQYEVKMYDYEKTIPGINTLYICQREDGSYFINEDVTQETLDYIKAVTAHNDVIDLYNTVQVQYNEVVTQDEKLSTFLTVLPEELTSAVVLSLSRIEEEKKTIEENVDVEAEEIVVVTKVKTTDVVNVRSSDSIEADRIGKTTKGQVMELVEEKVNGWSKIIFEGKEGFIKSEFLEPEETMIVVENSDETEASGEVAVEETQAEQAQETVIQGKVTDTVNVRKTADLEGEKLGKLEGGSAIEILEKRSDGWTKIRYKDGEAYVKSDYVE